MSIASIKGYFSVILDIIIVLIILIIAIPFLLLILASCIFLFPFNYFQNKKLEKEYADFLNRIDGANFFCYNNRKKPLQYIQQDILPFLPEKIEIIYLNGRIPESGYSVQMISVALRRLKFYRRFPHLIKVRNGELIDKSINLSFFNVFHGKRTKEELLNEIELFFSI